MRVILLILATLQALLAGRLQIILPDGHTPDSVNLSFNSDSLFDFNKQALGIGSGSSASQKITGARLFEKPKALIVISIIGLDNFIYDGPVYNFTDKFRSHQIRDSLKQHFGDDMIHAVVNSSGIFGSPLFKRHADQDNFEVSTNEDIQNMDRLSEAIQEKDRKNANVVDYYRIHLDASNARSRLEKEQLGKIIGRGIDTLLAAIESSTGGNVVAEIYTHEGPEKDEKLRIERFHKQFQVTRARFPDYPARSAIAMLIGFCLIFAVVSMLWFMFDDSDMGKNSLVYRLSTARQKKD